MARATAGVSKSRLSVRRAAKHGSDRPKKVGWQVRRSVAEAVKLAVDHGAAESQNAFVEDALLRRLKELRREKLYSAYGAAAEDPAFMEDMRSITEAFSGTVRDGFEGEA